MTDIESVPETTEKKKPVRKTPEQVDFIYVLQQLILNTSRRRMIFLYPALCRPAECLLVLGVHPKHLVFGNPDEGIALVTLYDRKRFDTLWQWLLDLGVSTQCAEAIDLGALLSAVNQEKGDWTKVVCRRQWHVPKDDAPGDYLFLDGRDAPISRMIFSLFTMNRLAITVANFQDAWNDKPRLEFPLPIIKDVPNLQEIVIPKETVMTSPIGEHFPSAVRLILIKGYDLLSGTQLTKTPNFFGLCLWHVSGNTIRYAAVVESEEMSFICARSNVFLLPLIP